MQNLKTDHLHYLHSRAELSCRALDKSGYLIIEDSFFLSLIETICCDLSSEPSR